MANVVGNARKVFDEFVRVFHKRAGSTNWGLVIDDELSKELGLTDAEIGGALDILKHKGLIQGITMDTCGLTPAGVDVCLDPTRMDDYLPVPAP